MAITPEQHKWMVWRFSNDLKMLCHIAFQYKDWSANPELHLSIARHLRKESKFKLFLLPRDHLKSSIITKAGATMRMLKNHDIRILIANNTWDNARKFLWSIQGHLVPGSVLSQFFGRFDGGRWNQDELVIRQRKMILDAPTIATTGLEKEQTSQHYDLIIADDLVARENVGTKEQREKVKDYINSLMALLEPNGEMWIVGTRWSQDDAYGDLIEEGIWDVLQRGCWDPVALREKNERIPIFPEKFTTEKLEFLRKKLGPYLFACWYENDPIAQEAADFKKEWIKFYESGTPHPSNLYLAIDPAINLSRDADYSAFVVGGMFQDRKIRVVECLRRRVVPSQLVDIVFDLVRKWKLRRVGIETFAFQKTLKFEMERRMRETGTFFSIDEMKSGRTSAGEPTRNKEARIRSLQPLFEQGLIEVSKSMTDLVDELVTFPRGKYDDMIDALSRLVDKLIPSQGFSEVAPSEKHGSMDWWLKNHMPKEKMEMIHEKFFADMR